jgi:hypothetical protein
MNNKEHKAYLKEFKEFSNKITSSKEEAKSFLIRSGINTKSGKLSKAYRAVSAQ